MRTVRTSAEPQSPGPAARRLALFLCLFCVSALNLGATEPSRWAILLAGVSGEPELQKEFLKELKDLSAALEGQMQFPRDHVFVLFDDPAKAPELIQFKSTRESLADVCRRIAGKAGKDDLVFVFITGHGSYDQNTYKLNLVGPDPTGQELASMLYSIPAQHFVVVNTTNASGGSLPALSQKGKIVITATKSGMERNRTHLGEYFVDAFRNYNADKDKNERVSILEAFAYSSQRVEEYYSKEGSLQTEHPVLDDNGDGQGHDKPAPDNGEGFLARTTYLDAGPQLLTKGKTPEEQSLAREAQAIEKQIEALKYAKAEMSEAEYESKLESLLLKLAEINARLKRK